MKRILTLVCLLIVLTGTCLAQKAALKVKTVYIPQEWQHPWPSDSLLYAESDPDNRYTWSKTRSVESDNVIVFWDKGYGSTLPSKAPSAYRVDEQELLRKCEAFYDLEINHLGFVDPVTSNLAKYKIMVLLNHTTDWVCYGAGYDYQVSALWLGPSACKPVGHSVAHEVGHSFHYMCYAEHSNHRESDTDNTGFHLACGNGQAIWEQTAQWQAAQSYPEQMFSQSIGVFRYSHNYAFSHEWHRYQSYWFHYYLCQHYDDLTTVAQVWNQPMTGQSRGNGSDFNEALMKLKGMDAKGLFRLYHDYASRLATWDILACKPYRDTYIGDFSYRCVMTATNTYQVALASAPQSSGFNVIPLTVPGAGTTVTIHFTALKNMEKLAAGDPAEMLTGETQWGLTNRTTYVNNPNRMNRAFRLGYVALMTDGTRQYFSADSLYCKGTDERTEDVTMTVPDGVSRLWFIVTPAPIRYVRHKWTEKADNAEMWPYRFEIQGTDVAPNAVVYVEPILDGRSISDATFTYDVWFPATTGNDYSGTSVAVSGQAAATLGTAFQMKPTDIAARMQPYSSSGPAKGKVMFYPCNAKTGALVSRASTANGYGHWFNAQGTVSDYGSGYVYSEFTPTTLTFNLGPYPNKGRNGSNYTISQALRYRSDDGQEALARFVFRIHLTADKREASLVSIDQTTATAGIQSPAIKDRGAKTVYDLNGHKVDTPARHDVYIVNKSKMVF